jgi:glycosyltransferase involved in cell wall biosynthesis
MNKQNTFKIIVTAYNDEEWVEYNLASILNQTYSNYHVMYYDDASSDNTYQKVLDIVKDNPKFNINTRKENKGALFSYVECLKQVNDEDIIVCISGDDWLFDENVLKNLNSFYNKTDVWMTYGKFYCWDGKSNNVVEANPQNTPYSDLVHKYKLYKKDLWRASHLRTFKGFLLKKLSLQTYKSKLDNQFFDHAADLAISFPCLELCGKEKIGVVDFPTYVYNTSETQQIRTQNRESNINNVKYEPEIRNRKTYKTLKNKTSKPKSLPQVNVFGPPSSTELCSIPTKFSYCYNVQEGEYDLVLLNDLDIEKYIEGKIKFSNQVPVVARLLEQRDYFKSNLMNKVKDNYKMFHTILTFDKILLDTLPNAKFCNAEGITAFTVFPNSMGISSYYPKITGTFRVKDTIKLFPKTKFNRAVCITSAKAFLPGHNIRLNFVNNSKEKIDLYGRGIREIESKLDVLHDYAFSLAIENNVSKDDYYFTEKLIECIITGTIPIYYGCPNISEFFDLRGIITFNTQKELNNILDNLNEEKYNSMLEFAKINFKKAIEHYVLDNDSLYNLHLKNIINGTTI